MSQTKPTQTRHAAQIRHAAAQRAHTAAALAYDAVATALLPTPTATLSQADGTTSDDHADHVLNLHDAARAAAIAAGAATNDTATEDTTPYTAEADRLADAAYVLAERYLAYEEDDPAILALVLAAAALHRAAAHAHGLCRCALAAK